MKKWLNNISKRTWMRIVLVSLFFMILGCSLAGEKVAKDNGIGWDGESFLRNIQHFTELITTHGYNKYSIQRIMPWGLVNIVFQACRIEPTPHNALIAGGILNVAALALSIFFFFRISSLKKWKSSTEIIAFASLFYSYALLKIPGYYILLSDTFGFLWGMMMLYLFLANKRWWLLFVSILGAVNWPGVAILSGLALMFLPREEIHIQSTLKGFDNVVYRCALCGLALLPVLFQLGAIIGSENHHIMMFRADGRPYGIPLFSFALGLLLACVYLFYMIRPFRLSLSQTWHQYNNRKSWFGIVLMGVCYLGATSMLFSFSNGEKGALGNFDLLKCVMVSCTTDPLCFVESFFSYFGPVVLLVILLWQQSAKYVVKNGIGYFFVVALSVFFSLRPEARVSIMFIPFMTLPVMEYIDSLDLEGWTAPIYALSAIVLSHVWFPINVEGMEAALAWENSDNYIEFPAQRYFMCTGHWQSHEMYAVWMAITIIVGGILYIGFRRKWFVAQNDK